MNKLCLTDVNTFESLFINKDIDKLPYFEKNLSYYLMEIGCDVPVHIISSHCIDGDTKKESILKAIDNINDTDIYVYVSIISTYEYPDTEYYVQLSEEDDDTDHEGKKKINVEDVLKSNREIIEGIGFVSVADNIELLLAEPFIYPNKTGKKLINHIKK